MPRVLTQMLLPSVACTRYRHDLEDRPKQPGPGSWTYCRTCSIAHEMAMAAMGSEHAADNFVQAIRRGL